MENAEEVFHFLEEFSKRKSKTIPPELNDYLAYVARTGDPVYQWSLVKCLFKEKLMTVITDFYETTPGIEIPPYPNVDAFNYDIMRNSLLERLDSFTSAPFTVQRICELLTFPRKQYNRVDKYMRAIEKNILVVSTREPGAQRHPEPDNGEQMEPVVNGSDNNSEYNVDVEMEDVSWKENTESSNNSEPQPSSSDTHISVDDLATRLHPKPDIHNEDQEKMSSETSVTHSEECNSQDDMSSKQTDSEVNTEVKDVQSTPVMVETKPTSETTTSDVSSPKSSPEPNVDTEMSTVQTTTTQVEIPEIKVEDTEMKEQKVNDEDLALDKETEEIKSPSEDIKTDAQETNTQMTNPISSDESSSDSNTKEEIESKIMAESITSSEENSSSSDNTEGNSNSPKAVENVSNDSSEPLKPNIDVSENSSEAVEEEQESTSPVSPEKTTQSEIQTDNYSISDVNSELPQVAVKTEEPPETETTAETESPVSEIKEEIKPETSADTATEVENQES